MNRLSDAIKSHATALDLRQAEARFGAVTSVDSSKSMVRVKLQPEDVLTGWLPTLSPWIGNGWGMVCLPSPGDQVLVVFQEGDANHGVVAGRAYSAVQRPPIAPLGEFWLVHQSGSCLKLANDGTIRIVGDLHVMGDVYDKVGPMSAIRSAYDGHTHTDSRGGTTSLPSNQI
jgi:phage baseplate assembly protein gpV